MDNQFIHLLNTLNSDQTIYYIDRLLTEQEGLRLKDILEDEGKTFSMTWDKDKNSYKITTHERSPETSLYEDD